MMFEKSQKDIFESSGVVRVPATDEGLSMPTDFVSEAVACNMMQTVTSSNQMIA